VIDSRLCPLLAGCALDAVLAVHVGVIHTAEGAAATVLGRLRASGTLRASCCWDRVLAFARAVEALVSIGTVFAWPAAFARDSADIRLRAGLAFHRACAAGAHKASWTHLACTAAVVWSLASDTLGTQPIDASPALSAGCTRGPSAVGCSPSGADLALLATAPLPSWTRHASCVGSVGLPSNVADRAVTAIL